MYATYKQTRNAPSFLLILRFDAANPYVINEAAIIINISKKTALLIVITWINDEIPNTKKILKILDPITFPNAISLSPLRAATIEVTNSGNEVPTATIVKPTKL